MKPKLKTIPVSELSTIAMVTRNEKRLTKVIHNGVVKEWVGFGWVDLGKPTPKEHKKLHHAIE